MKTRSSKIFHDVNTQHGDATTSHCCRVVVEQISECSG